MFMFLRSYERIIHRRNFELVLTYTISFRTLLQQRIPQSQFMLNYFTNLEKMFRTYHFSVQLKVLTVTKD